MADIYELQLSLDFPESLAADELVFLRRHLGEGERQRGDEHPLLADRGAATRIGGVLVGELCFGERGWALTARQEVHPDEFDDLRSLVSRLGALTSSVGVIGYLRFYEEWIPDLLIVESGAVSRMTPSAGSRADEIFGNW